jgi:glycosyltransferase involved in cell wall biosynthesis
MSTYNAAPFVGEALESVLDQSYDALELIVVDDCSSDDTVEIVAGYADRLPQRMRWKRKEAREGPCRARNDALALARGSLVCWMDHDDLWMPTKVEEQVRVLEQRPAAGLVYSYFDAFDSSTGELLPWPDGRRDLDGDLLADLLLIGCFIGSVTTMFRREALDRRGGRLRDRDFSIGDDYYLWLTIALDWQVAAIPRVLALYRRHPGNESTRAASEVDFDRWRLGLIQEFLDEFPEARKRLGLRNRVAVARLELEQGHVGRASRQALRASRVTLRPAGRAASAPEQARS